MVKRLTLSESDKKLFGVCSGIAKYFDVDPTIIRIVWIVLTCAAGFGILAYLICWAIMPKEF